MAQEGKTRWQRIQAVSRKNRYQNSLLICLLALAFAAVFLILTVFSHPKVEKQEQPVGLSAKTLLDGSWSAGVEEGFRDRFAGRERWLRTGLVMNRLFGAEENGGVYLGKDGYLFEKPADRSLENGLKCMKLMERFAASHPELRVSLITLPSSWTVLSEKVPEGVVTPNQKGQLNQLQQAAEHVTVVDLTDALKANKKEVLYYHTDPHITALGAARAMEAASEALGIEPVEFDAYTVSDQYSGYLAVQSGNVDSMDRIWISVPKEETAYKVIDPETGEVTTTLFDEKALDSEAPLDVFLSGGKPETEIITTANTGRRLLIIGDDWARSCLPLLVPSFEMILFLEPDSGDIHHEEPIKAEDYTDVLILCSQETFLRDARLANLLADGTIE